MITETDHAVARFQERVRPDLDDHDAFFEFRRLLRAGEVTEERPPNCGRKADAWVRISEEAWVPLRPFGPSGKHWVALTVLLYPDPER